ncbi:DUF4249 family protein [Litoribacter alkaliphilus]|uniref:DUF4249 family protein n=1 Tax=Litoribacter ruber TaxID=702568 RepID=A0AAP2G0U4_9BACT|nr:DUF4249 family protein [Litoribacter alkaliphilus]MBS9523474.1 DUF4249 family protein [Litoribacter alkaliphilus]
MRYYILIVFFLLTGCIDEVSLTNPQSEPKLVIDAWLSNSEDYSYVKVFYSVPFQSGDFNVSSNLAEVDFVTLQGLTENSNYYLAYDSAKHSFLLNDDFQFNSSETYRYYIRLSNGDEISSKWKKAAGKPIIEGYEIDFTTKNLFRPSGNGQFTNFDQIFLQVDLQINNSLSDIPYIYSKSSGIEEVFTVSINEFCTCTCYNPVSDITGKLNILKNSPNNNLFSVAEITMGRLARHYVHFDVIGLNETDGDYLAQIYKQQTMSGTIFDPMPFKINGEWESFSESGEDILGNFIIANHSSYSFVIDRNEIFSENPLLDYYFEEFPDVRESCTDYYPEASLEMPAVFH